MTVKGLALIFSLAVFLRMPSCFADDLPTGADIFKSKCADCHGIDGQGAESGHEEALQGDKSVDQLTKVIEHTMPEDSPEECVDDEARRVAEYIFNEFYSYDARLRRGLVKPARVELQRLTVGQYRNSVADLLAYFADATQPQDASQPGFRAEYFQSKGMSKADKLKFERVDRAIQFDFGEGSPVEDISAQQFAIIWQGALTAPATGFYEFRIRTQNGARLYLNNDRMESRRRLRDDSSVAGQAALIDAWVSSGKMREASARVFLLGGRQYPIRAEFFKYKEKTASINLEWKRPKSVWSVLNHHFVSTESAPRTFVSSTSFPADDRSLGYERGSSISQEWHAATSDAAIEVAEEVINRLPVFLGKGRNDDAKSTKELETFVRDFARVAYRRQLNEQEQRFIHMAFFEAREDAEAATRRAIIYVLKSPRFLYTDLTPEAEIPDQYTIASRLSFAIWDSLPDEALLKAADNSGLQSAEQIRDQARRMLGTPKAQEKMRGFFRHWLEIEERDLVKDQTMFPEFDESVVADLRISLDRFLDQVVWSDASDYRQLLLSNYLILNGRLRDLYAPASEGSLPSNEGIAIADDYVAVPFPGGQRAGVLTHPYLLSALAYHNNTSPIHRGVFVTRNIVGRGLRPPPIAVAFKNDEFDSGLSMREKITQLTSDKACMSCHSVINPLGFALENFDAVGRWRTADNDKPIQSESEYVMEDGTTIKFANALDIARFAVNNPSAHRAFVSLLFHHMVKQDPAAYGTATIGRLQTAFAQNEFNIQNLMVEIATTSAMHGVEVTLEVPK